MNSQEKLIQAKGREITKMLGWRHLAWQGAKGRCVAGAGEAQSKEPLQPLSSMSIRTTAPNEAFTLATTMYVPYHLPYCM